MLADRFRPLRDRTAELDAALAADQLAEQVTGLALGPGGEALDPALDQDLAGRPLDPDLVQQGLDDQRHLGWRPGLLRLAAEQIGHRDRSWQLSSFGHRPGAWR